MDVNSTPGDADVQLILKSDKVDYILCTLNKGDRVQMPLNLVFSEGDEISFRSVGKFSKQTTGEGQTSLIFFYNNFQGGPYI